MIFTRRSCLVVPAAFLTLTGCAPQRANFQLAFVPPPAAPATTAPVPLDPPALAPNPFLNAETPRLLLEMPVPPARPTPSDLLLSRAEESFQRGKRAYQTGDRERARRSFDRAVELLFEASTNPSNRFAYERKFDELVESIHRYDLAGLGPAVSSEEEPKFEKLPFEDILEMTFPVDPKLKRKVREELAATSSQLPLMMNDAILGFIHYLSGRGRKTMIAGLQRAGRYRPMIQRILTEEGIPQELIHLAQAESGFLPRAVSRKAAGGMWQFVTWRGREYGLMQTPHTDDRYDPERATRSAARHLSDLFKRYGDWYLAVAAYNCGPGNVDKAIERTGSADFWVLRDRRTLPRETSNYVPIILAMTIMSKNAKEYDLEDVLPDPPLEYDVVEMKAPTHLALVADLTETPVSQLQSLNPALLKTSAPGGYSLRVPKGAASSLAARLQTIPAEKRASARMHRVESGDTLATIGKQYGATASEIATANRLESGAAEIGDLLLIPKPLVRASTSQATAQRTAARRPAARARTVPASHNRAATPARKRTAQASNARVGS